MLYMPSVKSLLGNNSGKGEPFGGKEKKREKEGVGKPGISSIWHKLRVCSEGIRMAAWLISIEKGLVKF